MEQEKACGGGLFILHEAGDRQVVENMRGDPRYLALLEEMATLHCKKSADYGLSRDPFANIRASEEFGIPAWLGAILRGNDKMQRLKSFAVKGKLENESVEDSLLDLSAYALIALVLYREKKDKETILPFTSTCCGTVDLSGYEVCGHELDVECP